MYIYVYTAVFFMFVDKKKMHCWAKYIGYYIILIKPQKFILISQKKEQVVCLLNWDYTRKFLIDLWFEKVLKKFFE